MNANQNLPPELFDFYSDPACGWVHVPWTTFAQYYIDPAMFSNHSYADAFGAYLEEDYDLPRFIEIFESASAKRVVFNDIRQVQSSGVREKSKLHDYPYVGVLNDIVKGAH
jgi:hypothetical protein